MNVQGSLSVVKKYWDSAPVDVVAIARDLGLKLVRLNLPNDVSGLLLRDGNSFAIQVNSRHSNTRQRFTIAHELGHYIYHRDLLDGGIGDTVAYRAENRPLENPKITQVHEQQANTFAANLLMPNHLIAKLKAQGVTTPEALATALEVSLEAMRIKLGLNKPVFEPSPKDDDTEVRVGGKTIRS